MPNLKISELTSGNPAQSGDELPIARSGANFKVTAASIVALGGGVSGSTGATDNAVLRADGTGGATLQNSAFTIADTGVLSGGSFKETVYAITDGASVDLNPANGGVQTWTLGASRTATAASFAAGQSMILMVTAGAYSLTMPTMTWTAQGSTSGTAPTWSTTGKSAIVLWKVGTTLYGSYIGDAA